MLNIATQSAQFKVLLFLLLVLLLVLPLDVAPVVPYVAAAILVFLLLYRILLLLLLLILFLFLILLLQLLMFLLKVETVDAAISGDVAPVANASFVTNSIVVTSVLYIFYCNFLSCCC